MTIYTQFDPDPALNSKPSPLGAPEGATAFKQVSDTLRTVMAAIAELGALVDSVNYATETEAGLVELATAAEVATGTDGARVITPAGLAALTATLTRKGLVELATTAEFLAGTDGTRAVTPLAWSGNISTGNPGYIRFPAGLLIQFGNTTTNTGGIKTVTYPLAHTTTVQSLVLTPLVTAQNFMTRVTLSNLATFSMQMFDTVQAAAPSGNNFFWQSIGY